MSIQSKTMYFLTILCIKIYSILHISVACWIHSKQLKLFFFNSLADPQYLYSAALRLMWSSVRFWGKCSLPHLCCCLFFCCLSPQPFGSVGFRVPLGNVCALWVFSFWCFVGVICGACLGSERLLRHWDMRCAPVWGGLLSDLPFEGGRWGVLIKGHWPSAHSLGLS